MNTMIDHAKPSRPKKRRTRANSRAVEDAVFRLGGIQHATVRSVHALVGGSFATVQRRLAAMRGRMHVPVKALRDMRKLSDSLQQQISEAIGWCQLARRSAKVAGLRLPMPPRFLLGKRSSRPNEMLIVILEDGEI